MGLLTSSIYKQFQKSQRKKLSKGNMGNEHKWRVATLQGFAVPSKPLDVTLVGLQASQCYYPTLTMHTNLLVTLSTFIAP